MGRSHACKTLTTITAITCITTPHPASECQSRLVNSNEQICRICYRRPFVVLNAAQPRRASGRLGAGLMRSALPIRGPTAHWRGTGVDHFYAQ